MIDVIVDKNLCSVEIIDALWEDSNERARKNTIEYRRFKILKQKADKGCPIAMDSLRGY